MNKQQQKTIESLKNQLAELQEKNDDFKRTIHHLQPIVDNAFLNSPVYRKRFLTVGSEWECIADCYVSASGVQKFVVGDKVKIVEVFGHSREMLIVDIRDNYLLPIDQFLLCFKPKED